MSIEIKDRVAVGDNKYTMTTLGDGRVQLDPSPDSVQEEGTPINKALLQPILDALQTSVSFKRILTSADDLDDIRENGIYYFQTASRPANAPFENAGVVEVFGGESLSTQKIQRVYRYGASGQSAYRPLYNNGWLSWKRDVLVCGLTFSGTAESGYASFPGSISAEGLHTALLNGDDVNLFCDFPNANIERLYFSPASKTGSIFYFESPIFDGCRYVSLAVSASGAYLELKNKNLFLEEGTTGGWHYRKWADGRMEAWGKLQATVTSSAASGSAITGLYIIQAEVPFPTGMLSGEANTEYYSLQARNYRMMGNMSGVDESGNKIWGRFTTYASGSSAYPEGSTNFPVQAHIIGRWE